MSVRGREEEGTCEGGVCSGQQQACVRSASDHTDGVRAEGSIVARWKCEEEGGKNGG